MATPKKTLDRSGLMPLETPGDKFFWSCELKEGKREHQWISRDADMDPDDDDFLDHSLFIKLGVLGEEAVDGEENIVYLESKDCDGETVKGAILNLTKGKGSSMCSLDLQLLGHCGAKFILAKGNGPVFISGNTLQEYPEEDNLDNTQTEDEEELEDLEKTNDGEDDEEEEEEEEEEAPKKKPTPKRKAANKTSKQKDKKAKMEVDDDDEDDEDEDDEDDDESDSEEEKNAKKSKKPAAKDAKKGKGKPVTEVKKGKKKKSV